MNRGGPRKLVTPVLDSPPLHEAAVALVSWRCFSGGLSMVVLQRPAQLLPTFDRADGHGIRLVWKDQLAVEPLVITLEMIVGDELFDGPA